jgi:hypothetical protein
MPFPCFPRRIRSRSASSAVAGRVRCRWGAIALALLAPAAVAWSEDQPDAGAPAPGAEPQAGGATQDPPSEQRMLLLRVPTPSTDASDIHSARLEALMADGWRIDEIEVVNKGADHGADPLLCILLSRPMDANAPPAGAGGGIGEPAEESAALPGHADPVAPAPSGSLHILWENGTESTVLVQASPGSVRAKASVTTARKGEAAHATRYLATAFIDGSGTIQIDGRGAPILSTQPDGGWSPDSFAIRKDGTVDIRDDQGQTSHGVLLTDPHGDPGRPGGPGGSNGPAAPNQAPVPPPAGDTPDRPRL